MRPISILLSLAFIACCHPCLAGVPPVEYFAQLPDVRSVTLSPEGKKLSAITRIDLGKQKGTGIQVTDLQTGKSQIVLFSDNSKYFIGSAYWKDDSTLLVKTWYPAKRDTWVGMGRVHGDTRETRLLIVDTDKDKVVSPFRRNFLKHYKFLPSGLGTVVDTLPYDPDHILMSVPGMRDGWPIEPMVVKVDIRQRSSEVVEESDVNIGGLGTDQQNRVRVSTRREDDGTIRIRIRDLETEEWRTLWSYKIFSEDEIDFLGFDYDPNIIYISAYHNAMKAVYRVDLRDEQLKRELVYSDPTHDVTGYLIYGEKSKRVIGVGAGFESGTRFITEDWKKVQGKIDRALPNTQNYIYSITDDENKFMVFSTGPTESGTYYLGTRNPLKLEASAYRYKSLPPDMLGEVSHFNYKSRDGLQIEGYLTLPKGSSGKNLPTLMFPHGGPISSDSLSFDYWAHFFATRGYAVLQMNYRGSDGQGLEFRNSGLQKWGKEMQDDIEDGALAMIEKGIADPDRICIVGASYGGYAALEGVVKTPDRYRCAISVNGVSDVFKLVLENSVFWRTYNVVDDQIGRDRGTLKAVSPINHVKKIKAPVLLIHGEMDRQVDVTHSQRMYKAMQKAKKDVVYLEQEGEDHFLTNEDERIQAFKAMADFLDQHLPVTPL